MAIDHQPEFAAETGHMGGGRGDARLVGQVEGRFGLAAQAHDGVEAAVSLQLLEQGSADPAAGADNHRDLVRRCHEAGV